jgi:hypothetical protein
MATSYDDDERPSRLTHVIYNVTLGHVRVRSEDGPATTVEVAPGDVRFRRVLGAVEPETALWLDSGEQDYLGRMVEHVLGTMKITPEARAALEAVQAKLAALVPPAQDSGEGPPTRDLEVELTLAPEDEAEPPAPPAAPVEAALQAATPALKPVPADAAEPDEPPIPVQHERRPAVEFPPLPARSRAAPRAPAEPPATHDVAPTEPAPAVAAEARPRGAAARAPARARGASGGTAPRRAPTVPRPADVRAPRATRALPSGEAAASPPPAPPPEPEVAPSHPIAFATVWADLQTLGARRLPLHRLAGQTSSEIRDIDDDGVWLYSNSTGRTYQITRGLLEAAWTALLNTGRLVPREVRMNYGAVTLLAHLPYVDYSVDPVTLYYPALAPHPLGSVRRRDDES